ncbi:MAG: DUF5522 domain-containing protein [Acidobacteriota bacterium]
MNTETQKSVPSSTYAREPLVEGLDFYYDNGLMVLTARFLRRRGNCCSNDCRHCPYEDSIYCKSK